MCKPHRWEARRAQRGSNVLGERYASGKRERRLLVRSLHARRASTATSPTVSLRREGSFVQGFSRLSKTTGCRASAVRSSAYLEIWASPSRIVRSKLPRRSLRWIEHCFTPLGAGPIDMSVRCLPSPHTGSGNNVGHRCSTSARQVGSGCRQLPWVGGERKIEMRARFYEWIGEEGGADGSGLLGHVEDVPKRGL